MRRSSARLSNGQVTWTPRRNEEFTFQLGLGNGENEIGRIGDVSDPARTASEQNLFFDAGWKRFYAENSEISLRYYHYERKARDQYSVFPTNPIIAPVASLNIQDNVDVRRDDIEFQQIHAWSDTLTGLWGLGLRNDAAESPNALSGLNSVGGWQWQAFGNLDWTATPNWLLHAGGMVEKHYNTKTLFSPRLALNYHITPSQSLRFSFGRAFRAPTIYEASVREMVTWSGGIAEVEHFAYRNLEPEKLDYAEMGYVAFLEPMGLRIDARVYLNKYNNLIDEQSCILDTQSQFPQSDTNNYRGPPCSFSEPAGYERPLGYNGKPWAYSNLLPLNDWRQSDPRYTTPRFGHFKAFYYFNAGDIRVHGGDLGLDWKHPGWGRFRLSHAITRIIANGVGADVAVNPSSVTKDVDVEMSAPQHSTSLLWSKKLPQGLRFSLGAYWVGDLKWPNDGDFQPAYRRFDMRMGKVLKLFGKEDELSLTLQNFNEEHSEFREQYLVERRAFLTYRVNY